MVSKWKKIGKSSIVGKIGILFVIGLIISIPQTISSNLNLVDYVSVEGGEAALITLISVLGVIAAINSLLVNLLIQPAFNLSNNYIYLKVAREEKFSIKDSFHGFNNYKKAVKVYLLVFLRVLIGLILFIVPGIIIAYKYSMCFYILAEEPDISVRDCLKKSCEITNGNKKHLFLLDLSFVGWWILAVLTLGVLFIWVTPYQNASRTAAYLDLNTNILIEETALI